MGRRKSRDYAVWAQSQWPSLRGLPRDEATVLLVYELEATVARSTVTESLGCSGDLQLHDFQARSARQ